MMKQKYIAPRTIIYKLDIESAMCLTNSGQDGEGYEQEWTKKRQGFSSPLWGTMSDSKQSSNTETSK